MGIDVFNKKIISAVVIFTAITMILSFISDFSAEAATDYIYRDSKRGVSFTVPLGWIEMAPDDNTAEYFDVNFFAETDMSKCIMYGSTDLWLIMPNDAKKGLTRADIDNSILQEENFLKGLGIQKDEVIYVIHNGIEYMEYITVYQFDNNGMNISVDMILSTCVRDGIMYTFKFIGTADSPYYSDFISVLNSVEYPPLINEEYKAPKTGIDKDSYSFFDRFPFENILISLLITIFLYSLPIIIFRYIIRREPVSRRIALIITICYGLFAFILMSLWLMSQNSGRVAAGGAIIFWSTINYAMLMGGRKNSTENGVYGYNINPTAGNGENYNRNNNYPANAANNQVFTSPSAVGNKNGVLKNETDRRSPTLNNNEKPENIGLCREVLRCYHESAQFNSGKIINSLIMQGINPIHICSEEIIYEELFMFFIAIDSRFLCSFPEKQISNELYELTLQYFKLLYTQSYSSFKKIIADEVIHKYISLYAIAENNKISPDEYIIGYLYERILGDNIKYYNIEAQQHSILSSQVYPIFRGTWKAVIKNHGFKGFNTEASQQP